MKHVPMTLCLLFLGATVPFASAGAETAEFDASQQFSDANRLYETGELDRSLGNYESLVRRGYTGAALFYNIGNIHYKKGARGKAILWYERARRIAPRDGDIAYNLSLATSHLKGSQSSLLEQIAFYITGRELAIGITFLWWLFFVVAFLVIIGRLRYGVGAQFTLWGAGTLAFLLIGWLSLRVYVDTQEKAIVVASPGEVRNGPGTDIAVGFTLPEGSKVVILETRPDWVQIAVPDQGLKGWIPSDEVERINFSSASLG